MGKVFIHKKEIAFIVRLERCWLEDLKIEIKFDRRHTSTPCQDWLETKCIMYYSGLYLYNWLFIDLCLPRETIGEYKSLLPDRRYKTMLVHSQNWKHQLLSYQSTHQYYVPCKITIDRPIRVKATIPRDQYQHLLSCTLCPWNNTRESMKQYRTNDCFQ